MSKKNNQFRNQIFQLLSQIPKGKVVSYAQIAHQLDCKAYRAVAQVLKSNPNPIEIPCHRVVNASGKLGGYFGNSNESLILKKDMLEEEGVIFDSKNIISTKYFYQFK